MRFFPLLFLASGLVAAEPEFPLTLDSLPQEGVPKGTMIEGTYTAKEDSVFPGTVRDYQIYLPAGFDAAKPAPFMVFQDGVIYQAPVVFDNLNAKKDIPPVVGIFIRPGVVPAANDNALPRFNRSYEYDSITDTYSRFLIEEFLPAIEDEHKLKLSTDPNDAAIAGNSSGGICAFMVGWHRRDRFRRIFTGVGTYVGIHGADRLPVLVRKIEPKPLRVFLQSGTGDNNLYCGDWWMANQMMERSLTWAGYDVNHAWGEGGHNQKHASQVFPDALRWLWRDWQTNKEVKANPKGESKWKGYEVVDAGEWQEVHRNPQVAPRLDRTEKELRKLNWINYTRIASDKDGVVYCGSPLDRSLLRIGSRPQKIELPRGGAAFAPIQGSCRKLQADDAGALTISTDVNSQFPLLLCEALYTRCIVSHAEQVYATANGHNVWTFPLKNGRAQSSGYFGPYSGPGECSGLALTPDQTQLYAASGLSEHIWLLNVGGKEPLNHGQIFCSLESSGGPATGLCVDEEGRLYAATAIGIQVCDQAGRVNFIIPTPETANDVCFGGKDLKELFIACDNVIYKRPTKVHGIVSGQMPPIKPAPPKL